jgi:hypothetical protein
MFAELIDRHRKNLATGRIDEGRLRGQAKDTAHVAALFALSNPWTARRQLMAMAMAMA